MVDGIRALRMRNLELFKTIFSQHRAQDFPEESWANTFEAARQAWMRPSNGAGMAAMHVGFLGTADSGTLFVPEPTLELPREGIQYSSQVLRIPVVREGSEWKLDMDPPS